jgi:hypothetical protein
MVEDVTFTVDGDDGSSELTVPDALLDVLREGDESGADVVAEVALMGLTNRAHMMVHHGEGEVDDDVAAAEERALELFEERFGMTFGEATGHSH